MPYRFILLPLLFLFSGSLLSKSGPRSYTEENPERIAVFYIQCNDLKAEKTISQEDLEKYFFGGPSIEINVSGNSYSFLKGKGSPIADFWDANFNNKYHYVGKVFRVTIPKSETEFSTETPEYLVDKLTDQVGELHTETGNFNPDEFEKILFCIGENSRKSTGRYRGVFEYPRSSPYLEIDGNPVNLPSISCNELEYNSENKFCSALIGESKFSDTNCYPEFGLWGPGGGYIILHEWGHSFDLFHAQMPCGDETCKRSYTSTCSDYFQFTCNPDKGSSGHSSISYGNQFGFMGSVFHYSLYFNSAMVDKANFLSDPEKKIISTTQSNISLRPYNIASESTTPRVAIIRINNNTPLATNLVDIRENDDYPRPKAKISLYVEYRRAKEYDKNLTIEELVKNTEGLMINVSLEDVDIQNPRYESREKDYQEYTWLLDMTPYDGTGTVTLNAGSTFYHDEWEVSIFNVRPDGDEGVTFDVEYGKKDGMSSTVYRTAFFSGDYTPLFDRPILYSEDLAYTLEMIDGALVIKQRSDGQIVWSGVDQGIPKNTAIDKIELANGDLKLSVNGKDIWRSETEGHKDAKLYINEYGKLRIVDKDGTVLWSDQDIAIKCMNNISGAKGTLLAHDGEIIRLQMDWQEGSGFNEKTLKITNGVCTNCIKLGGLGPQHAKRAIYEIKPVNAYKPTQVQWNNSPYCGNGSILIQNNVLTCKKSHSGSQISYIKNEGFDLQLFVHWNESSPFNSESLKIENGSCVYCPEIDGSTETDALYLIKPKDYAKPVKVSWKDPGSCGDRILTLPSYSLRCDKSKEGANIAFLSNEGDKIRLKVDWKEGSGLNGSSLNIQNGKCIDCPLVGGSREKEATYVIEPTNLPQPVIISWRSTGYCGESSLYIPTYILPCEESDSEAKAVYLENTGHEVTLHMDWQEGSSLDGTSLNITNGECIDCPTIGGLNPIMSQATYHIKPTNLPKPIEVAWNSTDYCGTESMTLPNYDMHCDFESGQVTATFLPIEQDGLVSLHIGWEEGVNVGDKLIDVLNGECVSCPNIEGPAAGEAIYKIKPTQLPKPVMVKWADAKSCGTTPLTLPSDKLTCENSPTDAGLTFLSHEGGEIKLHVDWDEGSGFGPQSIELQNGKWKDWKPLGGSQDRQGVYTIEPNRLPSNVRIAWKHKKYCGTRSMTLPVLGLPCARSSDGAKITFLSNDAGKIKLHLDWRGELSGFSAESLEITNGRCTKCETVTNAQATYEIDTDDIKKNVIISWKEESTGNYCGKGTLTIPKPEVDL